ncbi:protein of unknown function [Hyphomicrobium sp. MC1]|nr:protein of unknown function [Hyphomicrobium sp. MC1]
MRASCSAPLPGPRRSWPRSRLPPLQKSVIADREDTEVQNHRIAKTAHLPVGRKLDKIGIPKTTFYAQLNRYTSRRLRCSRRPQATAEVGLEPFADEVRAALRLLWASTRWTQNSFS